MCFFGLDDNKSQMGIYKNLMVFGIFFKKVRKHCDSEILSYQIEILYTWFLERFTLYDISFFFQCLFISKIKRRKPKIIQWKFQYDLWRIFY